MPTSWRATSSLVFLLAACAASAKSPDSRGTAGSSPLVARPGTSGSAGTASSTASNPFGEGTACTERGATRRCCERGTQTCSGSVEFLAWSACLDANGKSVDCTLNQPSGCSSAEFATKCVDSGVSHACGEGEFGPDCKQPALCKDPDINTEPEILAAYFPAKGAAVDAHGQIKVWINDERPALIALGEQVDGTTGMITTPGDRSGKAPDGYLWEPALYIAPDTAENGGKPHFPQLIKGWYNNMPPFARGAKTTGVEVPGMEPVPSGTKLTEQYTTLFVWDVSALGLQPGSYAGEFVIHDGDRDRAIGCVTITVTN